jgi:hypothetical protein
VSAFLRHLCNSPVVVVLLEGGALGGIGVIGGETRYVTFAGIR